VEHAAADPEAPPITVVLVHGRNDSSASFARVSRLLGRYRLVIPDRRAHGATPADDRRGTVRDHADDLVDLLTEIRRAGEGPIVVIGHSFGGHTVLTAAAGRPDLVDSIGLYETSMVFLPWFPDDRARIAELRGGDPDAAPDLEDIDSDLRWVAERDSATPAPYDFDAIEAPVVFGFGSRSWNFQRRSAPRVTPLMRAEMMLLEGADHMAHRRRPQQFVRLIDRAVELGLRARADRPATSPT
jgi:pimeloyl-ACP methyl ester carboxylesterase